MTSCAFKIHRESEPAQGKPVLISILAYSLVFHAVRNSQRFQRKSYIVRPINDAEYVVSFVERFMASEVRCRVTDRQTHTATTVTPAAHAHRG